MWPFRKKKSEQIFQAPPAEPEATRTDWATLPGLSLVLEPIRPTFDTETFEPGLSTRRDPELFLAPLEHEVSEEAPSGQIEGLVTVVRKPEAKSEAAPPPLSTKEPEPLRTAGSDQPPARPVVEITEPPVVLIPHPKPTMTTAPPVEASLPRLEFRQPVSEAPPPLLEGARPEPEPDVSSPAPRTAKRDEDKPEPARSQPTLGRPQESPAPRKLGLGEPIAQKPTPEPLRSAPSMAKDRDATQATAPPEVPRPKESKAEPELVLQSPPKDSQAIEVGETELAARPVPPAPETGPTEAPLPPRPAAKAVPPRSPVHPPDAKTPVLRLPESRPASAGGSKPEVRPTLGGRRTALQRQLADTSPRPPSIPKPTPPKLPRPQPEAQPARPVSVLAPPARPPSASVADVRPGPAPFAPSRPPDPKEEAAAEPAPVALAVQPWPATRVEIPVATRPKPETPLVYSAPQPRPVPAAEKAEPPMPSRPKFPTPVASPVEAPPPVPEQTVVAQRVAAPASPAVGETPALPPPEKKELSETEADAIYEKIRTRLRKELRMYREQAGLSTYGG